MSKATRSPNIFSVLASVSFAFLLASGLFMACEKEVEVIVHDTVTVTIHDTLEIIVVDAVVSIGDPVEGGGSLDLTATVTADIVAGTLTYTWFATAGDFKDAAGDTVTWNAPDDSGAVTITVHATDGTYIGIGSAVVGVGMYAPTATEWYVGAATCGECHDTEGTYRYTYTPWQGTGHASAFDPTAPSYCAPCHTVGVNGLDVAIDGDAGYDDAPIATYQNVQCENCHGRGSAHQSSFSAADISISFDAAVCGDCHSGTHNPNYDEWLVSAHANPTSYPKGSTNCQGCHEGVAAAYRLSGDLSTYYDGGAIDRTGGVTGRDPDKIGFVCATCHDPHDATKGEHQLRTAADVVLISANGVTNPKITAGGPGKLCMQCHHARHSGEEHVPEGDDHFGPHHSNQADMLTGNSGYHAVAAAGFAWAQPNHAGLEETCITCHMHKFEYNTVFTDSAYTGHQFNPRVEACVQCHGEIDAFEDILAFDDYDGDGTVEGMEDEVHGLMTILETVLIDSFTANGITTTGWDADSLLDVIGIVKHARAPGDTLIAPVPWRAAGFNWVFVHDDGSHGLHNPDYAVQLLQQSFKHLTGNLPAGAAPLIGNGRIATR